MREETAQIIQDRQEGTEYRIMVRDDRVAEVFRGVRPISINAVGGRAEGGGGAGSVYRLASHRPYVIS